MGTEALPTCRMLFSSFFFGRMQFIAPLIVQAAFIAPPGPCIAGRMFAP